MNICTLCIIGLNATAKAALALWLVLMLIPIFFRILIKVNKLKPSRFTRFFYEDDAYFIESWEKVRAKGMIRYCIKQILVISGSAMAVLLYYVVMNKMEFEDAITALAMISIIGGSIGSLGSWGLSQDRYRNLRG